jgi:isopentenyldiphosphate isomerase
LFSSLVWYVTKEVNRVPAAYPDFPGIKHAAIQQCGHKLGIDPKYLPHDQVQLISRFYYWASDTTPYGESVPWGKHGTLYRVVGLSLLFFIRYFLFNLILDTAFQLKTRKMAHCIVPTKINLPTNIQYSTKHETNHTEVDYILFLKFHLARKFP